MSHIKPVADKLHFFLNVLARPEAGIGITLKKMQLTFSVIYIEIQKNDLNLAHCYFYIANLMPNS